MKKRVKKLLIMIPGILTLLFSGCQPVSQGTPAGENPETSQNIAPQENSPALESGKDGETIVILHTNDVHCAIDDKIGYDGLYLYKEEMMQEYDNVLLVDAGDAIQGGTYGAISKGEMITSLMNDVGYDCATIGNHEFDYGFYVLNDRAEQLNCGYVCTNFCTPDGKTVFEPYRMIERAGKKLAFIGVVTPETFSKSVVRTYVDDQGNPMYDFMNDETGERLAECVQKTVDEVREKGADFVILLTHLGNNEEDEARYHSKALIAATAGIDYVIDGHEHAMVITDMINKDGKAVPSSQTGKKFASIGKILIHPDNTITAELVEEVPKPEGIEAECVTRSEKEYWVDSAIRRKIEEYKSVYNSRLSRKVGESAFDLPGLSEDGDKLAKKQELGITDLVTDAMREIGESEIAMVSGTNFRDGLKRGDILYSNCTEVFAHGNDILVVKLKGQDILDALEFGARILPKGNNGLLHVSGMEYTVDLTVPSSVKLDSDGNFISVDGPYRVKDVMIDGEPLDAERDYSVTMSTYLQKAGHGMAMMKNAKILRYTQRTEDELLAEYIENNLEGKIPEQYQKSQNRMKVVTP